MVEIIKTRIEGADELAKVLKLLPGKMGASVLASSLRTGAVLIKKEAAARAPRDQGDLAKSIRVQKVKQKGTEALFHVGPDREHFYGIFSEFGTSKESARPWLRPAFDTKAAEALDKIGESLGKKVEAAAAKLAGKFRKSGLGARRRRR